MDFIQSENSPAFIFGSLIYTTEPDFFSGRHRTLALASLGFPTIPFLVSERAARLLVEHWGSVEEAMLEYDFDQCKTKLLIGH
ncbi:hypothetical protein D3C84_866990 [compost metagenome]